MPRGKKRNKGAPAVTPAADAIDAGLTPHERMAAKMGERLAYSVFDLDHEIEKKKKYARYVKSDPPPTVFDDGRIDANKLTEAQREARAIGKGWHVVTIPFLGMTRDSLKPSLWSNYGDWVKLDKVAPPDATEEDQNRIAVRNGKRRLFREMAKVIDKQSDTKREGHAMIEDALYGLGWFESDFDKSKKLGRIRWCNADHVLVDRETECDPLGEAQRWDAVMYAMPLPEAEHLQKKIWPKVKGAWVNQEHEFKEVTELWDDRDPASREDSRKLPTKFCRLVRVHVRGDSPWQDSANLNASEAATVEEVGDDPVYDGKNKTLILEATGNYRESGKYVLVAILPAPILDIGETPLTPCFLTDGNEDFYKPSFYQSSYSLCVGANVVLRSFVTKVVALSRTILGYDSSKMNKRQVEQAFKGLDALALVDFAGNVDPARAWSALQMGEAPKQLPEAFAGLKGLVDEVSARDIYEIEQKSHQPATNAALQDAQKQLRLDAMADRVESAYYMAVRKALMICRAKMTAVQVADWIGDEYMGWYDTENGVRKSLFWDDEISKPEDIRKEVDIDLEPRSLRFVSPDQEVNDIERLATKAMEFAAQIVKANEVNPKLAASLAKMANAVLRQMADRLHIANAAELEIDLSAASSMPLPTPGMVAANQPPEQPQTPEQTVSSTVGPQGQTIEMTGPAGGPMGAPAQELEEMQNRGLQIDPNTMAQMQMQAAQSQQPQGPV